MSGMRKQSQSFIQSMVAFSILLGNPKSLMKRKLVLYFTFTFIKRFYKSSFTPVIFLVNHISTCANHTFKSVMMLQRQPAVGPAHEILVYNALCRRSVGAIINTLILKLLNESIICPVTRCNVRCTQQKKVFFSFPIKDLQREKKNTGRKLKTEGSRYSLSSPAALQCTALMLTVL